MLNKICPCISWFSSESKPTKTYRPYTQFQQQQFMHEIDVQSRKAKTPKVTHTHDIMSEDIPIQEQIQNALNFHGNKQEGKYQDNTLMEEDEDQPHTQVKQTKQAKGKQESKDNTNTHTNVNNQIKKQVQANEEEGNDNYQIKPEQYKKQVEQIKQIFVDLGTLQINLPEHNQYYQFLTQKSQNAAQLLSLNNYKQVSLSLGKTKKQSKMQMNVANLQILKKQQQNNSFIIQFQLPCSYPFYNQITNRKIVPKDNHKIIKQSRLIQSIQPNLCTKYLNIRKVGNLVDDGVQFRYLKYTNISNKNSEGHWQLCASPNNKQQQQQTNGSIFNVTYICERNGREGVSVKVRSYYQISIKQTESARNWESAIGDVRKYVEEMWEQAQNNYSEQLV